MECYMSRIEELVASRDKASRAVAKANASLAAAFAAAHHAGKAVDLLEWIEAHLAATGTAPSTFGKALLNDPGFVRNLRKGRKARAVTDERVRRHLAG